MSYIKKLKVYFTDIRSTSILLPPPTTNPGLWVSATWVGPDEDQNDVPDGSRVILFWEADFAKCWAPSPPFKNGNAPARPSYDCYDKTSDGNENFKLIGSVFSEHRINVFCDDVYLISPLKDMGELRSGKIYKALLNKNSKKYFVLEDSIYTEKK